MKANGWVDQAFVILKIKGLNPTSVDNLGGKQQFTGIRLVASLDSLRPHATLGHFSFPNPDYQFSHSLKLDSVGPRGYVVCPLNYTYTSNIW